MFPRQICARPLQNFYAKSNKIRWTFPIIFRNQYSTPIHQQPQQDLNNNKAETSTITNKSTINIAELEKFSKISQEWWSPDGPFSMLHRMNSFRIPYIKEQLEKGSDPSLLPKNDVAKDDESISRIMIYPFHGLRFLDIGCGGGILSESLKRLGGDVLGADASIENIKMAQFHARKDPVLLNGPGKLTYRCVTVEQLLVEQEPPFDVICAMEIIEHVDNPAQFIKTCAELIKPGGHLLLSTISRTPLSYLLTILIAENVLGLVPRGTHDYSKYIQSDELKGTLEQVSTNKDEKLFVTDITGVFYNPLKRKWSKCDEWMPWKYDVNYFITARKLVE